MGGLATRDFDKVMKASKWFIFWAEQEFRLCRSAEEIFKIPSHAVWEQWRTWWKIRCIFCLCPLPGHFEQQAGVCSATMQQQAKVQMPKAEPSFQSIAELLPSLLFQSDRLAETWGGESQLRGGKIGMSNYMQVINKRFWQFFCWDIEVLQVQDNPYFQILSLSRMSSRCLSWEASWLLTSTYVVWQS